MSRYHNVRYHIVRSPNNCATCGVNGGVEGCGTEFTSPRPAKAIARPGGRIHLFEGCGKGFASLMVACYRSPRETEFVTPRVAGPDSPLRKLRDRIRCFENK
ncbi:hypothetical protein L596_029804 [Steinernema carpocapsae]|uniref:Uncharacterized protein n=1 Tax=Steinernema carpocapsae TaxID=34508 RepID=A0A4U5LQV7_STECR|nr:hypothetical protein L596_029804 [Steinernema carpocapsae]